MALAVFAFHFFVNTFSIWYRPSQIFELRRILKGFLSVYIILSCCLGNWDSSVSTVISLWTGYPGFDSEQGQ
jgi:hypothetical protein